MATNPSNDVIEINSSDDDIEMNQSEIDESSAKATTPATKHQMAKGVPLGEVMTDSSNQKWKIGPSISGTGSDFDGIYFAYKVNKSTKEHVLNDYPFVVKVVSHHFRSDFVLFILHT